MAIFGDGTGMNFSICAANYNTNSYESTTANFFSITITSSASGTGISTGSFNIFSAGSVTSFPLSTIAPGLSGIAIKPSYNPVRFNPKNGRIETFSTISEQWGSLPA